MSGLQLQEPPNSSRSDEGKASAKCARKSRVRAVRLRRSQIRVISTVVIVVALTCLFAECLARILVALAPPPDGRDGIYDAKLTIAKSVANSTDPTIIFIGDSVGANGIFADYVQYKLRHLVPKLRVVNLSTPGVCMEEKCFSVKTAIGKHKGPRLVVFQLCTVDMEMELAESSDPIHHFKKSYIGAHELEEPTNPWGYFQRFLNRQSYLIRYKKYWRNFLVRAIPLITETESNAWRGSAPQVMKECSPGGWSPWTTFPETGQNLDLYTQAGWAKYYREFGRVPSSQWIWDFHRVTVMQNCCRQQNVPLMYLWLPELTSKTSLWSVKHFSPEQCLARISAELGKDAGQLIDLHEADIDETHYASWDHLNVLGAVRAGEMIAEKLSTSAFIKQQMQKH